MTCIVGIAENGKVWMGGDSAASVNNVVHVTFGEKVFKRGEFLFGYSGLRRVGDILRHRFKPPPFTDESLDAYMSLAFADSLRKCFGDAGYLQKDNEREYFDGRMLIGLQGQLFYMDAYFAVHQTVEGYVAIGCGEEAALSALYVTTKLEPEERIRLVLEATARWVDGIRPPFYIEGL